MDFSLWGCSWQPLGPLGPKIKGPVFFYVARTLKIVFYASKWTSMPNFMESSKFAGWFMKFTRLKNINNHNNTSENLSNNNNAVIISDATLTWIQSCAFSLCYLSSPLANVALHQFPARLVMVGVSVALCTAFLLAAYEGRLRLIE